MKKQFFILILVFFLFQTSIFARKLKYKEEFYKFYYLPNLYNTQSLNRNIFWLEIARYVQFAPPIQALVICNTEEKYAKYKLLLNMHITYLMARNEALLGARFDKHKPVFFNKEYKEQILESLTYAEYHYKRSINYWKEMLEYKKKAEKYNKVRVNLEFTEDLIYRINSGELDMQRVANRKLKHIEKTKEYFSK